MLPKKFIFVSFSFSRGGAAKAASRFRLIAEGFASVQNISVEECSGAWLGKFHFIKRVFSYLFTFNVKKKADVKCSANFFSFYPAVRCFSETEKLHHIHWINNDTVSVFDLKKIPYGSIVTLHDEWLYCGVEHCFDINKGFSESPYSLGHNADSDEFPGRIHKVIWDVKKKAFAGRKDLVVTCPSEWLAERAKTSAVLQDCDVRVLYNPVDVDIFVPSPKKDMCKTRRYLEIDDRFLIVFGAVGGTKNRLKGFVELMDALEILAENKEIKGRMVIGLFGGKKEGLETLHGFPVREFGFINDEREMAEVYSLAHATIVPSKLESFGQVAAESQSCETPVIAFETSGLKDVVIDGKTGFLAEPFSPSSLAEKIELMASLKPNQYEQLCRNARLHVIKNFSNDVVAKKYKSIINEQLIKKQEACK